MEQARISGSQRRESQRGLLQARAVNDLHVDGELVAVVIEDQDADAATAGLERVGQAGPEVGLVDDSQALLHVAGLGHGDNVAVLHVKHAVLLEDGAEHGLDHDAGGRVGDGGGLLVELLGEEVHAEVAVLAGGVGDGNLDDLAGATLEHQEIADADVVAGDGDGVGQVVTATALTAVAGGTGRRSHGARLVDFDVNFFTTTGVGNTVGKLVDAVTERVVVACHCHNQVNILLFFGKRL